MAERMIAASLVLGCPAWSRSHRRSQWCAGAQLGLRHTLRL